MTDAIGVMVCGHGSRDPLAVAEFAALAERLADRFPGWPVDHGYLEFARPVIRDGLDRLVAKGARHILAVPGMLFAAGHAKNDIPSVLNTYQHGRPGLRIEYGRELGLDPKMIRAAGARIREALDAAGDGRAAATTRCSSSSAAAPPIPTPIPTSPRSPACSGRALASAGRRPPIPASPFRWSSRRWRRPPASASAASSSSPISSSPASWCSGSTTRPMRSPRAIPASISSRRPI